MKSIGEMMGAPQKPKKQGLSKRIKKLLVEWSLEAHRLDPSNSVDWYYELYLEHLRKNYSSKTKELFFKQGIIEV